MAKRRAKGSGRVLKAGKTWGIRYTEEGVRKYAGGYETKDKACEASATAQTDRRSQRLGAGYARTHEPGSLGHRPPAGLPTRSYCVDLGATPRWWDAPQADRPGEAPP
jgi:hypothetical protein